MFRCRCTGASLQAVFAVAFLPDCDSLEDLWSEFSDENGVRLVGSGSLFPTIPWSEQLQCEPCH
jgi:hypothetical protein